MTRTKEYFMSKNDKLRKLRVLKENADNGLQYLIDEAYQILGNPIILYDIDWKILAYPETAVTDDVLWNNHINDGAIEKNIGTYVNEGFIETMVKPDKVVLLKSEKVKYDRLFGKVFDDDKNILAGISVVLSNKPLENDDFKVVKIICEFVSKEILKIPYYQTYAQARLETCINMLIEKEIEDTIDRLYASCYVEMVYAGLKNYLYIAVADIYQNDPAYSKLEYYRDLFKRTRPTFKYSVYSNYIVIIMSTNEDLPNPKRCFYRLSGLLKQENIKVGISKRFENLFELSKHYNEAVCALRDGVQDNNKQSIYFSI